MPTQDDELVTAEGLAKTLSSVGGGIDLLEENLTSPKAFKFPDGTYKMLVFCFGESDVMTSACVPKVVLDASTEIRLGQIGGYEAVMLYISHSLGNTLVGFNFSNANKIIAIYGIR